MEPNKIFVITDELLGQTDDVYCKLTGTGIHDYKWNMSFSKDALITGGSRYIQVYTADIYDLPAAYLEFTKYDEDWDWVRYAETIIKKLIKIGYMEPSITPNDRLSLKLVRDDNAELVADWLEQNGKIEIGKQGIGVYTAYIKYSQSELVKYLDSLGKIKKGS